MRKKTFIFAMHGLVFSLYLIINKAIDESVYNFLQEFLQLWWAVEVCDLILSAFLYVVIYNFVYLVRKFLVMNVKKEVLNISGEWYHLHIKYDENGKPKPNGLRPGKTKVKQDLYDVHFSAKNNTCELLPDGTIAWDEDDRNDTIWDSWSVDWNGKTDLVTCFKAHTPEKNDGVFTERHGFHKLKIVGKGEKMNGKFADEYPSKSWGMIYFFRTEKQLYDFMKRQMEETEKNNR